MSQSGSFKKILKEKQKLQKYIELNKNENTIYEDLWDAVKTGLEVKYIALNTYIRKEEINILNQ